ncbi:DNA replication/repair protein RecF [Pseudaeromonas sharmana]|uniref:DNA replication and repair protein RecF n=1 Tax=Pseudaeromonas sharmana TaxID=328412 RepID=A0ABV8CLH6_9GAMM
MALLRLQLHDFRNIQQAELLPGRGLNVLLGRNGSGKTSLLEAIHYLGLGRSFRTHLTNRVIAHEAKAFTLFAQIELAQQGTIPLGLSKNRNGESQLKVAGRAADRLAQLAELLPLQLIHPEGFGLLTAGPQQRRAFIDWGVFHVDMGFYPLWSRVRRLLKQRNALLRQSQHYDPLAFWDLELARLGAQLADLRSAYCAAWLPLLQEITQDFLPEYEFRVGFYPGWDRQRELTTLLAEGFERDKAMGHTAVGPHKADLRLKANGVPVQDVLSRGQLKLLVCAMRLAQGLYLNRCSGRECLFLIDDFASELDSEKRRRLAQRLKQCASQVFITAIDEAPLADMMSELECHLFHVEQGTITGYQARESESKT